MEEFLTMQRSPPHMEAVSDDSGQSDDDTECAVAPSDPQRQQMQKELAQFRTMLSASQSQSGSGVDEPETPSMIQEVPSTISTERKKKKKKKKRTNTKKSRRRHERSNSLVSASDPDDAAPSNVPPPKENLAGCFPDTPPDPNPMLSHMLRRMDLGGIWNEEEEDRDQRGPVEIEPVTVAIEATAICGMDLILRGKCKLSDDDMSQPNDILGSNFVGVVLRCNKQAEERYEIEAGDRVASIVRWGGNAETITVPPHHLIKVPKNLDSADIASLISFFLPAFEALNFGRSRRFRYSSTSLKGKKVMITTEGATLEVQALISLARVQGSREIFVTAPREHHELLRKLGVATLDDDPSEWLSFTKNTMDVVVDTAFPKNFSAVKQIVTKEGYLICNPKSKSDDEDCRGWSCTPAIPLELDYLLERYQLSLMNHASLFDFTEYMAQFRWEVFEDMHFLLELLSTRKLRPKVDRFISLKDIPVARRELEENRPLAGAIICEPWKQQYR